jgi:hypothetical protein
VQLAAESRPSATNESGVIFYQAFLELHVAARDVKCAVGSIASKHTIIGNYSRLSDKDAALATTGDLRVPKVDFRRMTPDATVA